MVSVKMSKEQFSFFFGEVTSCIIQTVEEFLRIEFSVAVIITVPENSSESSDGRGTSLGQLVLDLLYD